MLSFHYFCQEAYVQYAPYGKTVGPARAGRLTSPKILAVNRLLDEKLPPMALRRVPTATTGTIVEKAASSGHAPWYTTQ